MAASSGLTWVRYGSLLVNPKLSREMRIAAQPLYRFRQLARVERDFTKNIGDLLEFVRVPTSEDVQAISPLSETEPIPMSRLIVSRGQLRVDEYGSGLNWTGKLEDLSQFSVEHIVVRKLTVRMVAGLDYLAGITLKSTPIKYIPTGASSYTITTDGSVPAAAGSNLNSYHVKNIVDYFKEQLWAPGYDGNDYLCVASIRALRGLRDDTEWLQAALYGDPDRLFNYEVGKLHGVRFVESNHPLILQKKGTGGILGEALFIADDPLIEGIVQAEHIRVDADKDFGRFKSAAWYYLGGFALTWDTPNPGEGRVIHVTGA